MRRLSALLSPILLMLTSFAHAQNRPEPIRLCVSTLQNGSHSLIDTTWQRDQLIKAFERANKGKDVTKGKAARIETVLLESNTETDPAVREQNCQFILHTNVIEIIDSGTPDINNPRPRSIQIGSAPGDPRTGAPDENRATVSYRIMRAGELEEWSSGIVRAHDQSPDEILLSHLMDQTANQVANELRHPH
ncbi:MAG TPA: hypothetical protein VKF84_06195 [Candidatus Sulfotelmatobacter sp.]|nr:hypothetical protein [Candidatus Sulfotelmatobacter sp.]